MDPDRFQRRILIFIWALFTLLVLLGIHGSSIGICTESWRPEKKYDGYLFNSVLENYEKAEHTPVPYRLRNFLAAVAQPYRRDEFMIFTPAALSQFAHEPAFPIYNNNIGSGQNMLLIYSAPVWHPISLVRPATWGYLFLGQERGLAWFWWFQPIACFTVLVFLLNILIPGRPFLSLCGAFWYCASAHVICWSNFPAYVTLFPALGFVCAYHLIVSINPRRQALFGALLGLSLPGFFMTFHPPFQVSLGLLFLILFVGVAARDGLWQKIKVLSKSQKLGVVIAGFLLAGMSHLIVVNCMSELRLMAQSEHFGKRILSGGGISIPALFKGFFNYKTNEVAPAILGGNPSEASSFFHLFPAIFVALLLRPRIRKMMGTIGWLLLAEIVACLFFMLVGVPVDVARFTFLSYVPAVRADHALGLASIFLSLHLLAPLSAGKAIFVTESRACIVSSLAMAIFVGLSGYYLQRAEAFSSARFIAAAAGLSGMLSFLLLSGRAKSFSVLLGICLLGTSFEFNPLCRGLDPLYSSELAQTIQKYEAEYKHPLWLCYGDREFGIQVNLLGGRSMTGVHIHPQPALWKALDPKDENRQTWNRYGYVSFHIPKPGEPTTYFLKLQDDWGINIEPTHPILLMRQARLVLVPNDEPGIEQLANLQLLKISESGKFRVYEIPDK